MPSPADAAAAIHRHDVSGDIGGIGSEKQRRTRDVLSRARPFEQGAINNFGLQRVIGYAIGGPHHRPRGDAVHPHLRAEFARQRAFQRWGSRLRQEQRRLEVRAEQIVPMGFGDFTDRGRVEGRRAGCAQRVQLCGECLSVAHRSVAVDDDVGACAVQRACDGGTYTTSATGDQDCFTGKRCVRGHGDDYERS